MHQTYTKINKQCISDTDNTFGNNYIERDIEKTQTLFKEITLTEQNLPKVDDIPD